jgi:sigma-B regulation protein RsbU (phosphoserine phosphatase)
VKVLVVDDSATSRMVLRIAVEGLGHQCVLAKDGNDGWGAFQREEPEAVISDWVMPGMDGITLCRQIREDTEAPYTYFVMLTSLEDRDSALSGMLAGADDYLTKPFDPHEIEMRLIAAARVTDVHRHLRVRTREMEDEVRTAAGVQQGLLAAPPPVVPGAVLGGLNVPAADVGGDYYDFMLSPSGEIVMVIADVAGHSISSALLMAMARSVLREQVGRGLAPHDVLEATNATMYDDLVNAGLFITLFCAGYSPTTGFLTFANGGHNAPLVRRAAGTLEELDADGAPAGLLPHVGFELGHTHLAPGDLLVLYTDGVVEAGVENDNPFGDERLAEVVASCGEASPDEVGRLIHAAVVEHAGEVAARRDDITVAGLRVNDPAPATGQDPLPPGVGEREPR